MQVSRERIHGAATAAHQRTKKLVNANCSPDDCSAVCGALVRDIDEAFEAARAAGTAVACAIGCDFCCHLRVSVFEHEAVAVLHHLTSRLPQADAAAAEQRIVQNAARIDRMTVAEHYAACMPCALLVDGRCAVYDTRPSACAAHHSLSRTRCKQAFQHPEHHGTPENGRPASLELQTLGDALIAATQSALQDNGRNAARRELHQSLRDLLAKRDAADPPGATRGDSLCST